MSETQGPLPPQRAFFFGEKEMRQLEITVGFDLLQCANVRRALTEAFGLDQDTLSKMYRVGGNHKLLVTAEQFGMFITLRNLFGGKNLVAQLEATPITPPQYLRIDCTEWRVAA